MLTRAPGCRAVCQGKPGDDMEHLIAAFKQMRAQGKSEEQALLIARDPIQIAALLPASSLGSLHSIAEAMVISGCAECAVNLAYAE